jgi:hypothetical protein
MEDSSLEVTGQPTGRAKLGVARIFDGIDTIHTGQGPYTQARTRFDRLYPMA